jgi:hypothetical protein
VRMRRQMRGEVGHPAAQAGRGWAAAVQAAVAETSTAPALRYPPRCDFPHPTPRPCPHNLGGGLPAPPGTHLEVLGDLAHQALEGQLADEQLGGFLVLADLTQGNSAGPVAVRLLHAAGGGRRLARGCRRGEGRGRQGRWGTAEVRNGVSGELGGHRNAVPGWRAAFGRPAGRGLGSPVAPAPPSPVARCPHGALSRPSRPLSRPVPRAGSARAAGGRGSPPCPAKNGAPRRPAAWMRHPLR